MSQEAELPGRKLTLEALQMICLRYQVISRFVSGKYVLEAGCGGGLGLKYMARTASRVVGGDYSLDNLRGAQKRLEGQAELVLLDAHYLPFGDKCFDVVAAMQVVQYLDIDTFLNECHRVIKKDGILIINLPNRDRPYFQKSPFSKNYFSAAELQAALARHNFDADVFGAFPVPTQPLWSVWQKARRAAGIALNLVPQGKRIKAGLASATSSAGIVLKNEVGDYIDSGILENIDIAPINPDLANHHYQILYATAQAR